MKIIFCKTCGLPMNNIKSHVSTCRLCRTKICHRCNIDGYCSDCFIKETNNQYKGDVDALRFLFPLKVRV